MNEVDKMYKLANVAKPVIKKWCYDGYYEDFSWQSSEEDCTELLKYFDNSIDKLNDRIQQMKKEENTKYDRYTDSIGTEFGRVEKAYMVYPPFTAEKQLNIVKFLLNKSVYYDTYGDKEYWFHLSDEIKNSKYREFDEAIAECINKMWEDLRDYEKVQIKEILE